jgi:hypothetical protein
MDILSATTNLRRYTGNAVYDKNGNPIKTGLFISLKMMGLQHYYKLFKEEEIDFVAISLMDESDIRSLVNKNDLYEMLVFVSFFQNINFFQHAKSG